MLHLNYIGVHSAQNSEFTNSQRHQKRSFVVLLSIVNPEHISHILLVFLLLTLNMVTFAGKCFKNHLYSTFEISNFRIQTSDFLFRLFYSFHASTR